MSENVTLDRIDVEKITEQAKAARAEYLRRHGVAALVVVGSTLAIALTLDLLFGPRTDYDQLAATVQMERVATNLERATRISPETALEIVRVINRPKYDCAQMSCRSSVESRNKAVRGRLLGLLKSRVRSEFSSVELRTRD